MAKKYSSEWWSELRPERIGAETEALVKAHLDKLSVWQEFTYHRMPDAKAARGALPKQPGDYLYGAKVGDDPYAGFIEVKACKHLYRLERSRLDQLPKLNLFSMASYVNYVIVFHYLSGQWRIVDTSQLSTDVPSWHLEELGIPSYSSIGQALASKLPFGYFSPRS